MTCVLANAEHGADVYAGILRCTICTTMSYVLARLYSKQCVFRVCGWNDTSLSYYIINASLCMASVLALTSHVKPCINASC